MSKRDLGILCDVVDLPTAPFVNDASTVGLFHFEEGAGGVVLDGSFAAGGPSDGDLMLGGTPVGPEWSALTPFN